MNDLSHRPNPPRQAMPPVRGERRPPEKQPSGASRLILYIFVVLLVLTPTYLALADYTVRKNAPVVEAETTYTEMQLFGPTKALIHATLEDNAALITVFNEMLNGAVPGGRIPTTDGQYTAKMTNAIGTDTYVFYFSLSDNSCYFTDAAGAVWQAPQKSTTAFLGSPFAFELYPQASTPVLTTAATDEVIPSNMTWWYRPGTVFIERKTMTTTDQILTYPIAEDVGFDFSIPPDRCTVVIKQGETVHYSGGAQSISLPQLDEGTLLDVTIEVGYNQSATLSYYGDATYRFQMRFVDPAEFSIDRTSVLVGDFLQLSCRNIKNEQKLQINSTLSPNVTPVIYEKDNLVYALIPVTRADDSGTLTVAYGTISSTFTVTAAENPDKSTVEKTLEAVHGDWNTLSRRIAELCAQHGATTADGTIQIRSFATLPSTAVRLLKYGDTLTVSEAGGTLLDTTVPFELYATDAVTALAPGRVCEIGSDVLLGNYVILDHGAGLRTWYCGLDTPQVQPTQVLAVGEAVGTAGNTGVGFVGHGDVLIITTLGTTPISADALR